MKHSVKRVTRELFLSIIILILSFFLFSCIKKQEVKEIEAIAPVVHGLEIVIAPLIPRVYAAGIIRGVDEVVIVSTTDGKVKKINFDEGDSIKNNAILLQIENETLDEAVLSARNGLRKARSGLANAQRGFENGAVTQAKLEEVKATYYSTLSQYNVLKTQQEENIIRAPLTGYVAEKNLDIRVGDIVRRGSFIARVSNRSALKVEVSVSKDLLSWIAKNNKVIINVPSENLGPYDARIKAIDLDKESEDEDARVEIVWTATKELYDTLHASSVAEVVIETNKNVTGQLPIIPKSVIVSENDEIFIYTARKSDVQDMYTVEKKIIQTGREFVGYVEITDGLKDETQDELPLVIISSTDSLFDGQLVSIDVVGTTSSF